MKNRKESDLVEEENFSCDIFGRMNLKMHLLSEVWIKKMVKEKEIMVHWKTKIDDSFQLSNSRL